MPRPLRALYLALALGAAVPLSACSNTGHQPPAVETQPQTDQTAAASPNDLLAVAEVTLADVILGLRAARDAGLIERGGSAEATITGYVNAANDALKKSSAALTAGDLEGWARWYGLASGGIGWLQAQLAEAG